MVKWKRLKKKKKRSAVLNDIVSEPSAVPTWQDSSTISENLNVITVISSCFVGDGEIHKPFENLIFAHREKYVRVVLF